MNKWIILDKPPYWSTKWRILLALQRLGTRVLCIPSSRLRGSMPWIPKFSRGSTYADRVSVGPPTDLNSCEGALVAIHSCSYMGQCQQSQIWTPSSVSKMWTTYCSTYCFWIVDIDDPYSYNMLQLFSIIPYSYNARICTHQILPGLCYGGVILDAICQCRGGLERGRFVGSERLPSGR